MKNPTRFLPAWWPWRPATSTTPAAKSAPLHLQESWPLEGAEGYRSLSAFGPSWDPSAVARQQQALEQLWLTHPLVGQIVTLHCDFSIGAGLTVIAGDPIVQQICDRWIEAQPEWEALQRGIAAHLAVYGEAFCYLPADTDLPRAQLIAPTAIARVDYDRGGLLVQAIWERRIPRSAAGHPDPLSPGWEMQRMVIPADQLIHVKAQAGTPGERGVPELARILPWVARYDDWLQDRVRINKVRGSFAFLRKVPSWGIDPTNPQANHAGQQVIPRPGAVLVVNEQESWEVLNPEVRADDVAADGRALKLMILGGAGIAEHYVGDLAESNLATAQAAELPMLRRFEAHQRRVLTVFRQMFARVLERLGQPTSEFTLTLPAPGLTDARALTETLQLQLELGLISRQTAQSLVPWITDVPAERARIAVEQAAAKEVRDDTGTSDGGAPLE